ncbi:MAG: hypothetical protein EAZ76_03205 [Nostocales cyanobacterium]|nr:MAG: hypothetical protein EAZ87_20440 [Nostocales cyanobacterium]TAF19476.1 MAG: hypothetical protein EAZ76_03205 [Nostocales cyanobacterium]
MLNNISKIIPKSKSKIAVSLLVTAGVLGLSTASQMIKINLKSQVIAANMPGYTNQIQGSENSLLSKLRSIRDKKNQYIPNTNDTVESGDLLTETLKTNVQIPTTTKPATEKPLLKFPEQDGIYLYGQSSIPNQFGQGYIVFEKNKGRVTGALYMPNSEFSCFQGTIAKSGELAMTVTSSPTETGIAQVSTTSRIPRVTDETSSTYAYSLTLQDYYHLPSVNANDRAILQSCQQEFSLGN